MSEYNANLPWPMRDLTSKKHLVKAENHPAELRHLGIHKMHTHTPQISTSYLRLLCMLSYAHPHLVLEFSSDFR